VVFHGEVLQPAVLLQGEAVGGAAPPAVELFGVAAALRFGAMAEAFGGCDAFSSGHDLMLVEER